MTGKKVDTGVVACIIVVMVRVESTVKITGTGNTPGCIPGIPKITFQERAEAITVTSVPLGPSAAGRERTYLIQSTGVPCLGNQLDISKYRVIGKKLQKWWIVKWRTIFMSSKDAGKVETETIHTVVNGPVA